MIMLTSLRQRVHWHIYCCKFDSLLLLRNSLTTPALGPSHKDNTLKWIAVIRTKLPSIIEAVMLKREQQKDIYDILSNI